MHIDAVIKFGETVVAHHEFKKGLGKLNNLLSLRMQGFKKSQGVALLGESGLGKTTLLKTFMKNQPHFETTEGSQRPMVLVTVPPKPTGSSLSSAILEGLGDPLAYSRDNEASKRNRVIHLIKKCGVEVMILDEIQHLSSRWGEVNRHDAADSFKVIMDATNIMMVLSGLEYGDALFRQNEQFRRRFTTNIRLSRFAWRDEDSRKQFRGFLNALKLQIDQYVSTIDLSSSEVAFRFYLASGGMTSRVVAILEKALSEVLLQNSTEMGLLEFAEAYSDLSAAEPDSNNPFTADFRNDNKDSLIDHAANIGLVSAPQRNRSKKMQLQEGVDAN